MKKTVLGLSLAALTLAGAAVASSHSNHAGGHTGGHKDPFGDKTVSRSDVQAHAAEAFAKFDANKDGKLDAADRAAHHGQMFDKLDTNKDGSVSRTEFDAAHQGGQKMGHGKAGKGGKMAMMMLHMADTNKDRAVSRDEFVAAHLAMFDKADTDKDGKVTLAERQAAHAKMREHMEAMKGKHGGHAQHGVGAGNKPADTDHAGH